MGNWDTGDYMAVVLLICFIVSICIEWGIFVIGNGKTDSKKSRDIIKCFPLVSKWLDFPDSNLLTPDIYHYSSYFPDSYHQRIHAIYILNSPLPEQYKISEDIKSADFENFEILFQEYQKVLCREFFSSSYLFSSHYKNYFSHKNKKMWHTESLVELWGGAVEENIFFAETWYDFLDNALDYPQLAENGFYFYKDRERFLSDFGKTAYKVYLSAFLVKEKLGYTMGHTISDRISSIESDIACDVTPDE